MPNIKSAIKRVRSDERKTTYRRNKKSELRTVFKRALEAKANNVEGFAEIEKNAQATIDRAYAKGVISKNTAARRKSRLAKTATL